MTLNSSPKYRRWICAAILVLMVLANFLTPRVVDDWNYSFSFATGEPITSLADIGPSMKAHAVSMNGRIFAHSLVQALDIIPPILFDILNAAVFLALIWLIYLLCRREREENNLLLAVLFGAVWVFSPAFGQVFLWLDGSCNYGWGALIVLCWLFPYVRRFLHPEKKRFHWTWLLWCILGFFAGGYLENTSASGIFLAVLLLLLARFYKKEKNGPLPWLSVAAAAGGFLYMMTRPAEGLKGAQGGFLAELAGHLVTALTVYSQLKLLVFFFAAAFVLCCVVKTDPDRRTLSVVFLLGSLCSNFIMAFAIWYPARCLLFPTLLLIIGCGILFADLFSGGKQTLMLCVSAVLAVSLLYNGVFGMADVANTWRAVRANERTIAEARENGIGEVHVPMVKIYTKYSALYDLKYLDTEDPNSWPNHAMARSLGVEAIIGYWEE